MFGILEAISIPRSEVYSSIEDVLTKLNERMGKEGYKVVKAGSHRSRKGGAEVPNNDIVRCDFACDRGGRYRSSATSYKTSTKKTGCPWKARAHHKPSVGGWVLTIACDQHNHEARTPDLSGDEAENAELPKGPTITSQISTALQAAGVSENNLRLNGETFSQLKRDYKKLPPAERMQLLASMQIRIAALYAIQNEDVQRLRRQELLEKRREAEPAPEPTTIALVPRANKRQRQSNVEDGNQLAQPNQTHPGEQPSGGSQTTSTTQPQPSQAPPPQQAPIAMPNVGLTQQFQPLANYGPRGGRRPNP